MKKIFSLYLLSLLFATQTLALNNDEGRFSIKGGFAQASIAKLGPLTAANFKVGAGLDYWLNKHWFFGADLGLGSEGYGKVIGTTSLSMINLVTGNFLIDPGLNAGFASAPINRFSFYASLRLGFPLRSGYPAALSLGPTIGTLIEINEWVALDLAASVNVVANFNFNYLATIFSIGSIGFRVFI